MYKYHVGLLNNCTGEAWVTVAGFTVLKAAELYLKNCAVRNQPGEYEHLYFLTDGQRTVVYY